MQDIELFHELLNIEAPWQVLNVHVTRQENRLDIHLGYNRVVRKTLFGFGRKKNGGIGFARKSACPHCQAILPLNGDYETVIVRHLPTLGFATYLHVPAYGTVNSFKSKCQCMRTWRSPGTSCTVELFDQVVDLLMSLKDSEQVRNILGLTSEEMQQILETSGLQDEKDERDINHVSRTDTDSSAIPEFSHPGWLKLVRGEIAIVTKTVALSMLIRRVQASYEKKPDIDSGIEGVKILRQFFRRNERLLANEISMLKGSATSNTNAGNTITEKNDSSVPNESSQVWQHLATGELQLITNQVGLQMLLSQVQKSVTKTPQSTERIIRNIRNYFVQNERRLSDEISQLNNE